MFVDVYGGQVVKTKPTLCFHSCWLLRNIRCDEKDLFSFSVQQILMDQEMICIHSYKYLHIWVFLFDLSQGSKHALSLFIMNFFRFQMSRNDQIVFASKQKRSIFIEVEVFSIFLHQRLSDSTEFLFLVDKHRIMIFMLSIAWNELFFPINKACLLKA